MPTATVTFPNGRTATLTGPDRASVQREIDRLTASMAAPAEATPDAAEAKGPTSRPKGRGPASPRNLGGFGTGLRDVMVGAAGTVGVLSDPLAAWGNVATDKLGLGTPFSTAAGAAENLSDRLGLAPATTPTGRVISTVNRAVAGIMSGAAAGGASAVRAGAPLVSSLLTDNLGAQVASGVSGSVAGGLTAEETDNPWLIGAATMAGSFLPGAATATRSAFASRRDDSAATRLLLTDRAGTAATGYDDVQAAVRRDYQAAMDPFEAQYANLDNLDRPQYTPPPEINPVEWGLPVEQAPRNVPISTRGFLAANADEANQIVGNGLEGVMARVGRMDGETLTGLQQRRSVLLSEARAPAATPDARRIMGRLADAVQDDIDETLLSTAVRDLSSNYRRQVIGPFEKARKGGALNVGADASDAWKALRLAGREDLQRLSTAVSPETREVIRQRAVADIVEQENRFIGLQSGSGAPVWRDMDKRGMGAFFTRDEWRGLQRLTGRSAFFKHPATRIGAAAVGVSTGGIAGGALALFADWLATTTSGRLFMARAGAGTARAASESARTLLANPGTLQAEIQQSKDRANDNVPP